ncbi:hypothetical protein M3697_09675 [Janibacter melonis]|uniref:hypothetical protein n=1 Tax=Janibacter melonis TaxID=262209 RepID=UPI002044BE0A|nr:hypothetical protein [Janibacter melonis]MCM3555373.1 hypothetical protein [Janibacter melonis]
MQTEKLIGIGAAGLAALGLGVAGASIASADDTPSSGSSSTQGYGYGQGQQGAKGERPAPVDDGRELSGDAASKAIAASQAEESDATVKGVHLGRDGGFDVMMLRTDGTMVEVAVDDSFTVTGVEERDGRGGPGGHGAPGQASGEDSSDGEGSDDTQPPAPQGQQQAPSPSASSTAS